MVGERVDELMRRITWAAGTSGTHRKAVCREKFSAETGRSFPGRTTVRSSRSIIPRGGSGRPPTGLEGMPRITLVQKLRNLSDSGAQEALHEPVFMCRFVGIDIGREPVPDEAAILKFRHLLHERHLSRDLFRETHRQLESRGVRASQAPTGAPSSTPSVTKHKNQ